MKRRRNFNFIVFTAFLKRFRSTLINLPIIDHIKFCLFFFREVRRSQLNQSSHARIFYINHDAISLTKASQKSHVFFVVIIDLYSPLTRALVFTFCVKKHIKCVIRHSLQMHLASFVPNDTELFIKSFLKLQLRSRPYQNWFSLFSNSNKVPFEETDRVDSPESIYAATKKANELMANVYSSQMGLPTTGLRFFTVYGPWGRPDMAPFLFLKSILEGKSIKVFNNGNLSRDFSYIDDIVTGVVKILEGEPAGAVYNIGNSSPVELMEFISTIEKVAGKEAIKEFAPMQQGDVYTTYASTKAIERDFGFKPNTPLQYGIEQFCKWYRTFYGL